EGCREGGRVVGGGGWGGDGVWGRPPAQIRTGGITAYGSYFGSWRRSVHSGRDAGSWVWESRSRRISPSGATSGASAGRDAARRRARYAQPDREMLGEQRCCREWRGS